MILRLLLLIFVWLASAVLGGLVFSLVKAETDYRRDLTYWRGVIDDNSTPPATIRKRVAVNVSGDEIIELRRSRLKNWMGTLQRSSL